MKHHHRHGSAGAIVRQPFPSRHITSGTSTPDNNPALHQCPHRPLDGSQTIRRLSSKFLFRGQLSAGLPVTSIDGCQVKRVCFAFEDNSLSRQFFKKFSPSDKKISPYLSMIFVFVGIFYIELDIDFVFREFLEAPINKPKPLLYETLRADQFPNCSSKFCSIIAQMISNNIAKY